MEAGRVSEMTRSSTLKLGLLGTSLDDVEIRVLGYAAALGKEFDFNVLRVALEIDEEILAEALESLVHKGIFREVRGGDTYLFTKEETMAAAAQTLSSSRMRVVHKKIADAYERMYPDPPPEIIPEMGRHYYLGKIHEKSMLYNRYSATIARNNFSPDVAIHYLERVRDDLASMEGDHRTDEADTLRELGDLLVGTGDASKADEMYARALEKLPQEEETMRALILLARAEAAREMDRLMLVRSCCEAAIQHFEAIGNKKGQAMAHRLLSRAAYKEGNVLEGKKQIEVTLSLLNPQENAKDMGRCYIDLGNVCSNMDGEGDQALAESYFRKAIEILEPLKDYRELFRAHNNLAVQLTGSDPKLALEELEIGLKYAEKAKDKRSIGWALFNMVEFHLKLGQVKEAEKANEGALAILSKLDDKMGMQQVRLNQGILAQHRKDYKEAEKWYLDSLSRAVALGYMQYAAEVHVRLALMHMEAGDRSKAASEFAAVLSMGTDKVIPQVMPMFSKARSLLAQQESAAGGGG